MRGAYVLIALSALFAITPLISVPLSLILSIVGLVFIYCWVVLWLKRYHDGGKSGWMCLVPIIVWLILSFIASSVVSAMFGGAIDQSAANEAAAAGDLGAVFQAVFGAAKATAIQSAIAGALVSFIVAFVFNRMIKSDDHENQFG